MARNVFIGSATSRKKIQQHLRTFNFKALFIEELGWDILKEPPLTILVDGTGYTLRPLVEKRGVRVFVCDPDASGRIPTDGLLRKIEREITRQAAYEQFIIYIDAAKEHQVWQWVKREQGNRTAVRINRYHKGQSGELLAQKLERLAVRLEEEEHLHMAEVVGRVAKAFDVERVTKKFYDRFKLEHTAFLKLIQGLEVQADREWYASLMLNRLMFIYFIQRQGFLDTKEPGKLDGDPNYLSNRLKRVQQIRGEDQFHTFYRYFLLKLFHDGLSQRDHSPELDALLGKVPYLNGGLFDVHVLERLNPKINIPDEAFVKLFAFFDEFDWHLDDRPLHNDREINPDVLGYIFEKYINQKQMGAYYTKEDITEYISKNTILPFILEAAEQKCQKAFRPDGPVWVLLRENPDTYIYDAVKKGCELELPPEIEVGVHDVAQRGEWNKSAPEAYALPTETWREVVARRTRYQEVRAALMAAQITSVNDLITYNLDIRKFTEDVITYCTSTDLLRALYDSIAQVTVLDPTCGSGAFLFAALTILEGLYEACLERMQDLVEERAALDEVLSAEKRRNHPDFVHFRSILEQVGKHPNRAYFIYKSIIINNLYGVDIMEEATEICKLRLFLKLVSQIDKFNDIEPLPDIDFNIRAGNTLVGFASYEETKQAIEGRSVGKGGTKDEIAIQNQMIFDDRLERIEQKAQDIEHAFEHFRKLQTTQILDSTDMATSKQLIRKKLEALRGELDSYLASEYGIDRNSTPKQAEYDAKFAQWQQSHQPFHWWVEFYGIMKKGGFDIIIGNPPYVEIADVTGQYSLRGLRLAHTGNLYSVCVERFIALTSVLGHLGVIVPISSISTPRMLPLMQLMSQNLGLHISNFAVRPGKLFVGVDMNLTILIGTKNLGKNNRIFSTGYNRWSEENRSTLFKTLDYSPTTLEHSASAYPKLSSRQSLVIKDKVARYNSITEMQKGSKVVPVYYHSGGRYFRKCIRRKISNEYKELKVSEGSDDAVICLLSSSFYYWLWITFSDCYHVTKRDIGILPFPTSLLNDHRLKQLASELVVDLEKHAQVRIRNRADGSKKEEVNYHVGKSKPIIDEIDHVLAKHYGFTDEELDFIINYDIKYRMGRGSGDGEEE